MTPEERARALHFAWMDGDMNDEAHIQRVAAAIEEAAREAQDAAVVEGEKRIAVLTTALRRIKQESDAMHADGMAARKRGETSRWFVTDALDDAIDEGANLTGPPVHSGPCVVTHGDAHPYFCGACLGTPGSLPAAPPRCGRCGNYAAPFSRHMCPRQEDP